MVIIYIAASKVAENIIKLFSDSRVMPAQWKFDVPMHIVQQQLPIVANAKNFADGIHYNLMRYQIDLPEDIVVAYSEDKMNYYNGKVYNA